MSREWYRFFLNIFNLAGSGGNQTSLDDLQIAPAAQPSGAGAGTVTSVDVSGGATGLTTTGGPVTTSGVISLGGILNIANGGTGSSTGAGGPFALKGANTDITSMSGLTGDVGSPTSMQMGNGASTTLAAGKMWYDQTTGSWNLGMGNGNITQQVGEELFVYGKASAAITDSPLQIVYHTGTVGSSGVIKFAPTIAGLTNPNDIIGVATENLALNAFGRITTYGVVRGITTNGTAFGETWADDDPIWYNPVTGNPTKVEPVAPYIKVQVGLVIKAGPGGSGSFQVGIARGSKLGGTDSNVQIGTLANKDLLAYDSALGYWKNSTFTALNLGSVTSVGLALPSIMSVSGSPVTTSGTLTGTLTTQSVNTLFAGPSSGAAAAPTFRALTTADIPALSYVSSVGATAPITTTGGLTPTIGVTSAALNKTNDTNVTLTLSGSPSTALLAATTMDLGWTGQLAVSRGGTGVALTTANFVFAGPSSGSPAAPTFRALTTADIPALGGATISNDTSTSSNIYPLFSTATSGALVNIYTSNSNYLYKPSTGELSAVAHVSNNGIQINANTVATSYTIATGNNGLSAGPVSVNTGVTVTISSGSTWTVV